MAKKKKEVPKDEKPDVRFKRVIQPRVGKALKAISLVGSVTGSAYKYNDEQAAEIVTALRDEVDKVEARFGGTGETASGFKLSS